MILMPLPKSDYDRRVLLVHESFHRIQGQLGLIAPGGVNSQLDEKNARVLLRLEWQALTKALNGSSSNKTFDIQSALVFRMLRRQKYPNSAGSENAMEIHEGLAEYTGIKLGIDNERDRIQFIVGKVSDAGRFPSLVRSFPYESGPLYCLLLDQSNTSWRKMLNKNSDLGELTKNIFRISLPSNLKFEFEDRKSNYQYKEIIEYKSKFVSGKILIIPLLNMKIQFDPRNLISLGEYGTVYPTLKIVDNWGILEVDRGALLSPDWKKVIVPYPEILNNNILSGAGWKLTLKPGWKYIRNGENLTIER